MENFRQWPQQDVFLEEKVSGEKSDPLTVESIDNHVYFYSRVNTDRCLDLIKKIRRIDKDLRNEKLSRNLTDYPDVPIWLHIQSYGGSLFTGFSMMDQLKDIPSPVYSVVEGVCASAATLISLSCDKRFILPSGFMLIHEFWTVHWGKYGDFKDEMRLQERLMDRLVSFYSEETALSREKVSEILSHDYWMNAEEALENGFVDKIIGG